MPSHHSINKQTPPCTTIVNLGIVIEQVGEILFLPGTILRENWLCHFFISLELTGEVIRDYIIEGCGRFVDRVWRHGGQRSVDSLSFSCKELRKVLMHVESINKDIQLVSSVVTDWTLSLVSSPHSNVALH